MASQKESRPNFMERTALNFLRRFNGQTEERIHQLEPEEFSQVQQEEKKAIFWGAAAGAISGTIAGLAEISIRWWLAPDLDDLSWRDQFPYWAAYTGVVVVVSGIEILFLYWTALRGVGKISSIAGLRISSNAKDARMGEALARAALEFPNSTEPICGIDPYARVPKWKRNVRLLLYRMKIGFTSFFLRVLLRRILGRAALRFFIPLIALPVFAFWNGLILFWVLRQARIRILGPVAVRDFEKIMGSDWDALKVDERRLAFEAVGEAIIRSEDAHPNFALLLNRFKIEAETAPETINNDPKQLREKLGGAGEKAQAFILKTLVFAAILDGRLCRSEVAWIEEAHAICARKFERENLVDLYRKFMSGEGVSEEMFHAVSPPSPSPHRAK
jgi:hypothetical protein